MNSEAIIAIPRAYRKNANSTLLIVAFEGEDHRERDELTKDLAGSDRKDMVSQRPKERIKYRQNREFALHNMPRTAL